MYPSSSRVKLNRVALKNVIEPKLVPRRRRAQVTSPSNVAAHECGRLVSEPVSVKDIPVSNEPAQTFLTHQICPESVPGTTGDTPGGEAEENRVDTQRAKRRDYTQSHQDINRNTHPGLTGHAGSEGSLRRAVRASACGLCGDLKYVSPRQKPLSEPGEKSNSPGQERPMVKAEEENRVTGASQKIIVWIGQYPKVTLCDVAQKCHAFSQDCGYTVPDVLKSKVVRCFKQDMRAGFQFGPGCLGHNKGESEECAVPKNRQFGLRVESEKSIIQSYGLSEHQRPPKERTDAQTLSSHTTRRFLKSRTTEGSATCSASFSLGKRAEMGECGTRTWDRDDGEDPEPGSHVIGVEIRTNKRVKLGDGLSNGILPSTPDSEHISCPATKDFREKEKTCFWMSGDGPSCSENAGGGSSASGSAVKEHSVHKKSCGEIDGSTKPEAALMSSELFCQSNEVDSDDLESFTCQRVRVYVRKSHFSCARTYMSWPFSNADPRARAATTAGPGEPTDPDNGDSLIKQTLPGTPSNVNVPTGRSSDTAHRPNDETREQKGGSVLAETKEGRCGIKSSSSPDKTNRAPHLMEEDCLAGAPCDATALSSPGRRGVPPGSDAASSPSLPASGPQTDSSRYTPSPSTHGLSDCETATTLSSMSSPFTYGGLSSLSVTLSALLPSSILSRKVKSAELADAPSPGCMASAVEMPLLHCEETRITSPSFAPPHNSDSFQSCESSLLLPQDEQGSDEELVAGLRPPNLEPYYSTSPVDYGRMLHSVFTDECVEAEPILPPMLSPVTSPRGRSRTKLQRTGGLNEEKEEVNEGTCKHKTLLVYPMPPTVNSDDENSSDDLDRCVEELEGLLPNLKPPTNRREPQSSPSSDEDIGDGNKEDSQDETDCENNVVQDDKTSEQVHSGLKRKGTLTSGVLTTPSSSPSTEDDGDAFTYTNEGSHPSGITGSARVRYETEVSGDARQGILDEFTAYEQDILLVDVIQDDPELFTNLPQESLLKLGPTRVTETPTAKPVGLAKTLLPRTAGASQEFQQRLPPVRINFHCNSLDVTEKSNNRPWRPHCGSSPSKAQINTCPAAEYQTKNMNQPDANNNHINEGLERSQHIKTVTSLPVHIPPLMTINNGPWITNTANMTEFRRQKYNAYCRQYFSESLSCGFKMCRFQHVPMEGDEKFCVETVTRFTKNPMCLPKAGAVFSGYYHNNPPGVYFSMPVLLSLLWALLKAGMVSDVFSVLSVSLAHKIVPGHEFLLALFNFVREKGLMSFVPELMQLTFKMANAGLVLSLDCLDCVKNTPEVQQTVSPNSGNHKLSTSTPFPEYLNLAQAVVEIELCTKQEDWRRLGEVFRSVCQSSQRPNLVEQISGRIVIALLSESKDKLSLPFTAFSETVCQNEGEDSLVRRFLGRIGVSLMLRYHKTHQWAKGRRVVETLSITKVNYATLKGLFGNEDRASRCCLVTVATELFLLSGSVEGALNTLRENKWFLSSCSWPCELADLESRTRVLVRLAEKTSHRDTLEVLCNLPGLKEPNDLVSISRYCPLFNSHLQVCVDRQTLPVASDTVDFMLSKNLAVDQAMLQILLHKLGKQNLWLRAREVFRHSLSVGYYPGVSAPPGFMTLIVPCRLGEVELALTFEMFITVNAAVILHASEMTSCSLSITLKRTQGCESEYLSAGSRLLSAACIPQPKLVIHYKAVNPLQEQVFALDVSSARCWLRHNHLWANEVWTH